MTDREKRAKIIKGLERIRDYDPMFRVAHDDEFSQYAADAIALLKRSFTPQEVYDTVIDHAQHDKRFKLGDKIDYSFTDAVDILNVELMCKAGDM